MEWSHALQRTCPSGHGFHDSFCVQYLPTDRSLVPRSWSMVPRSLVPGSLMCSTVVVRGVVYEVPKRRQLLVPRLLRASRCLSKMENSELFRCNACRTSFSCKRNLSRHQTRAGSTCSKNKSPTKEQFGCLDCNCQVGLIYLSSTQLFFCIHWHEVTEAPSSPQFPSLHKFMTNSHTSLAHS